MDNPMYQQIAKELGDLIESGEIAPGNRLPTELELRDRYNASRNTVRDAIKRLAAIGLVETKPGQGAFAAQLPFVTILSAIAKTGLSSVEGKAEFAAIESLGRCPTASVPRVEVQHPEPDMADKLHIPEKGQVITRRQERYIDQAPWSVQTTAYPMELVMLGAEKLRVAKDITDGAVAYIEQELGISQIGCRDTVEVRQASEEEGRFFKLSDDGRMSLVSVVTRTGYRAGDAGPMPFRATSTVFLAERVQFVIDSGDVPRFDTPRSKAAAVLRPADAVPAGHEPRALANPARRLFCQRSGPVFLADGPGDGEEEAENHAECDGRPGGEHDENDDGAGHDKPPSFPSRSSPRVPDALVDCDLTR
jgi:GntR family transcriptional regulator